MKRLLFLATPLVLFATSHITSVTAITKVYGDGEHIAKIVLSYDAPILASSLSSDDFSVEGRQIVKAALSDAAGTQTGAKSSKFIALDLAPLAFSGSPASPNKPKSLGKGGPKLNSLGNPKQIPDIKASISQTGTLQTATATYPAGKSVSVDIRGSSMSEEAWQEAVQKAAAQRASEAKNTQNKTPNLTPASHENSIVKTAQNSAQLSDLATSSLNHPSQSASKASQTATKSSQSSNNLSKPHSTPQTQALRLGVRDFTQHKFIAKDGESLEYNLFIPKDYNASKTYPLVLFMHDAGAVSPDVLTTLTQGRGAVAWSESAVQDMQSAFVLAPQYSRIMVDDNYAHSADLDRTIELINELKTRYNIGKIYNSGQSMGGMTSLAMDMLHPGFFAGSYVVASKWEFSKAANLSGTKLFLIASENDPGAKPSMDELTSKLTQIGRCVKRLEIDAKSADLNARVASLFSPDCDVYYLIFKGGDHRYTWQYGYDITPALIWLLKG
ncbi:hypothetical protein [Campylobacter sp. 19-13652]|uniref:hypothetical protein n=1 Tax=Campylobacter sp. 19-13652 TaxID=2840180 RepID=UPI001C778879|nr:hypothetical protein [Campylobacter sp. 19-13652]BCX79915.1 hypothetical protein LBC_13770 [Campylobacter sp. 19-13652]